MTWSVEWDDRARRELRKLDPEAQREILRYFRERIAVTETLVASGRPLLVTRWACGDTASETTVRFAGSTMIASSFWCCG